MPLTLAPPDPVTEEDGYRNLAFAVLASLINDLQNGGPKRRQEAQRAVLAGVPTVWLDLLDLPDAPRARVEQLLADLVRA